MLNHNYAKQDIPLDAFMERIEGRRIVIYYSAYAKNIINGLLREKEVLYIVDENRSKQGTRIIDCRNRSHQIVPPGKLKEEENKEDILVIIGQLAESSAYIASQYEALVQLGKLGYANSNILMCNSESFDSLLSYVMKAGNHPAEIDFPLKLKLFYNPRLDLFFELSELYEKNNRILEANDALNQARHFAALNDEERRILAERKERLEKIIESTDFSDFDYCNCLNKFSLMTSFGRSGSMFLNGILDNHPELLTLPVFSSSTLFDFYKKYVNAGAPNIAEILDRFKACYAAIFDGNAAFIGHGFIYGKGALYDLDRLGEAGDVVLSVDYSEFEAVFLRVLGGVSTLSAALFVKAVFYSYTKARGVDISFKTGIPWMLQYYHGSSVGGYYYEVVEHFGFIKILFLTRSPVQLYASTLRVSINKSPHYILLRRAPGLPVFVFWKVWSEFVLPQLVRVVKFEDLKTIPEESTRWIADYMGIDWNPSLLETTVNGFKSAYKTGFGQKITGFDKSSLTRSNCDIMSENDERRLSLLSKALQEALFYKSPNISLSLQEFLNLLTEPFDFENMHSDSLKEIKRIFRKTLSKNLLAEGLDYYHNYGEYVKRIRSFKVLGVDYSKVDDNDYFNPFARQDEALI